MEKDRRNKDVVGPEQTGSEEFYFQTNAGGIGKVDNIKPIHVIRGLVAGSLILEGCTPKSPVAFPKANSNNQPQSGQPVPQEEPIPSNDQAFQPSEDQNIQQTAATEIAVPSEVFNHKAFEQELDAKWVAEGFPRDLRYGGEYEEVQRVVNGEMRTFVRWRIGFTEVWTDKELVEKEYGLSFKDGSVEGVPWANGGVKKAGQMPVPNLNFRPYPGQLNTVDAISMFGAVVNARHSGFLKDDGSNADPGWYPKFLEHLASNPDMVFPVDEFYKVDSRTTKSQTVGQGSIGDVVTFVVLPPRQRFSQATVGHSVKIEGGSLGAPFGLDYYGAGWSGYGDMEIDADGSITLLFSPLLTDDGKIAFEDLDSVSALGNMLILGSGPTTVRNPKGWNMVSMGGKWWQKIANVFTNYNINHPGNKGVSVFKWGYPSSLPTE